MDAARASVGSVETPRMTGSPIGTDHVEDLVAMHADERVMRTLGGVRSQEDTVEQIERHRGWWDRDGFGYWAFSDRETGDFVGRGGLRRLDLDGVGTEVEVGWAVVAERWREGLATEMAEVSIVVAFEVLELESVVAFTMPTNEASLGVMRATGFVFEREFTYAELPHRLHRRRR